MPEAEFKIRMADLSDASVVLDFTRRLAEHVNRLDQVTATPDDICRAMQSGRIEAALAEQVLPETGPQAIGCMIWYEKFSTFSGKPKLYLEDFYLNPEIRGQKLGVGMLQFFAEVAKKRGCDMLEWQVIETNTPAISFYRRIGARESSAWQNWGISVDAMLELTAWK